MRIGKLFATAKARKSGGSDGSNGPGEPGAPPVVPGPASWHDDAHTITLGIVTPGRAAASGGHVPPRPGGAPATPAAGTASGQRGATGRGRRRKARPRRGPSLRRPRIDYPRAGRRGVRRWVPSWRLTLGTFLFVFGALSGVVGYAYSQTEIPADLNDFATQQDNVYYWADGTEMGRTGQISRQATALKRVPEDMRWAVLAAENASFYFDSGVSPTGMFRAVTRMVTGGDTQGASTIT